MAAAAHKAPRTPIAPSPMSADSPHLRLGIVGVVVLALMGTLFARLWYLQVLDAPEYQVAAEIVQVREVPQEATRGRILDRNGKVIVDNRISIVLSMDPGAVRSEEERTATLVVLAEELTRSGKRTKVADLERRLADPRYNPVEPRPLAIDVDEELAVLIGERAEHFPGIAVQRRAVRVYPYGSVGAHLLGYVGRISPDELAELQDEPIAVQKPYQQSDEIGKAGIERIFENDLRGTPGLQRIEVDADEVPLRTLSEIDPIPGHDLQLTIDIDVQAAAEKSLAEQVRSVSSPGGSVAVMDPSDGSVLALASYPTYDPTEFVNGISNERFELLQASGQNPLLNRALQSAYPPGSTFKLVTAFAGLDTGLIDANSSYFDNGVYRLQGCNGSACEFRNAQGASYQTVGAQRALTVSSNVFFAWLGERFWIERDTYGYAIADTARSFGLGSATGVQLPLESSGFIPDPDTKAQRHDDNPEAFPDGSWYTGDNVNSALGQGDVLASPLQIANLYGTFGNGGRLHSPNIVWRVLDTTGDGPTEVVRELAPRVVRQVEIRPGVRDPIVAGLLGVTASQGGTAANVFEGFDLTSFPVAAKTGTAEVRGKEDNAVFAAYGPNPNPRVALAVVVEQGGFGSSGAGPVARYLFDRLSGQVPLEQAPASRPVIVVTVPEGSPTAPTTTVPPTSTAPPATQAAGEAG